jgi:hypothetical protein
MALALYSFPDESAKIIDSKPFTVTFDGRRGGSIQTKIYIRNDDSDRYYTDLQLVAYDTEGDNIVDGSQTGFEWKIIEKDIAPTLQEWEQVSAGNTLSVSVDLGTSVLGDIITYIPCWIMVNIPRSQPISTITDVVLRIQARESAI